MLTDTWGALQCDLGNSGRFGEFGKATAAAAGLAISSDRDCSIVVSEVLTVRTRVAAQDNSRPGLPPAADVLHV